MKLYELTEAYRQAQNVDEMDEEQAREALDAIEDAIDDKIHGCAKIVCELEAQAAAVKDEADRLARRRQTLINRADWLKTYVQNNMRAQHKDKIAGDLFTVSIRKGPPKCDIESPDEIPDEYKVLEENIKIDRRKILEHYRATGEIIDGVQIHRDEFLSIR